MRLIDADAFKEKLAEEEITFPLIDEQPTVDAVPVRHGKWVEYPIADGMNQCSECGMLRFGCSNYCPNCGAKMDERKEE